MVSACLIEIRQTRRCFQALWPPRSYRIPFYCFTKCFVHSMTFFLFFFTNMELNAMPIGICLLRFDVEPQHRKRGF